jgi:hypothetical protein
LRVIIRPPALFGKTQAPRRTGRPIPPCAGAYIVDASKCNPGQAPPRAHVHGRGYCREIRYRHDKTDAKPAASVVCKTGRRRQQL